MPSAIGSAATDGNYFNAKGIPCVALTTGMVDEHATTEHLSLIHI